MSAKHNKNKGYQKISFCFKSKIKKTLKTIKLYSSEIQAVCAIASVVLIGALSIYLTFQSNNILKSQLEISKYQSKPTITFSLIKEGETDRIEIYNECAAPVSYSVDVITYFSFLANENTMGKIPIRVFTFGDSYSKEIINDGEGKLAQLDVFGSSNKRIIEIDKGVRTLAHKYNDLYWQTVYIYLIRVECIDVFNEISDFYYLYDGINSSVLSVEDGEKIINEWEYCTLGEHGDEFGKEDRYLVRFEDTDIEFLFANVIDLMRSRDLYAYDINNEKYEYGEYEPEIYFNKD